jgi:hypothetical protein
MLLELRSQVTLFIAFLWGVSAFAQLGVSSRTMKNVVLIQESVTPIDFQGGAPRWYNGNLYCVDFTNQAIVMLDTKTATIKQQFGRKGAGPGEFQAITGYTVDKSGISVIDGGKLMITEFDHQGNIRKLYKYPKQMISAVPLAPTFHYLVKPLQPLEENKELFEVVNIDKQTRQSVYAVSRIAPKQVDAVQASLQSVYFEGTLIKNGAGKVFRVPWLCSEFFAFDETSGRVLYGRQTIDRTGVPTESPVYASQQQGDTKNVAFSLSNIRKVNLSATANAQYLFVLSNAASPTIKDIKPGWTDERVVDAYNVSNGDYAFSFVVPKYNGKRAREIAVTDNTLCVSFEDEIVRYSFRVP